MSGGARKRGRLLSDDTDDSSADDGDVPVAAQSHVAATSDAASRPIAASDSQLPIVAPAEGVQSLVESSSTAPLTATSTASVSQESVVVDLTEDNESLAGDLEIPMFRVYTKVVGLNFYRGRVNTGEMVFLVREPSNVYDRNAIRVDDLTRQQVGHVAAKDGTAGTLAPIADGRVRGGVGGTLEAVIVDTPRSTFAVAMVTISGLPEHKQQLAAHMTRAGMEFMDLESGECTPNFAPPETKGRTGKAAKARPSATYTRLSEEEVHSALHRLWDQTDADVAGLDLSLASASCASLARCLLSELYPHQRQGVAWMLQQETGDEQLPPFFSVESVAGQTVYRHALTCHDYPARPARCLGGLLLDDMGLGKTLQIAALVLCNPPAGKEYFPTGEGGEMDAAHAPTLVVCPVSVISSWLDQLQSHLREGTFKVLVYHGSNRVRTAKQVCEHDVVITTYETLSADCRDSTTAPSTSKSPAHKKRAENGPLFGVDWHRVVFDEAHVLRNMRSSKYKACRSLSVKCVWCLTGTPIANSVSDIEALIQLIRLEPFTATPTLFNSVIAKPVKIGQSTAIAQLRTLVKRVSLRRSKKDLKELQLAEKVEINVSVKFSEKELKAYQSIKAATADYMAFLEQSGTGNLLRNSSVVLALITRLRQCCLDVRLIPALALVKLLDFCPGSSSAAAVARLTQEQQEELLQKFTLAFAQASSGGSNDSADEALEESILECCICMEAVRENGVMLRVCQHLFCKVCMDRLFAHDENIDCPLCRRRTMKSDCIGFLDLKSAMQKRLEESATDATYESVIKASEQRTIENESSKTQEIVKALRGIFADEPTREDKVVIFSSFTGYLSILHQAIEREGIGATCLTGSMTATQRSKSIRAFSTDPETRVILCSLKASGTGITLTAGNHVFLSDIWWSPAADNQAIDRVHRIGQTKTVFVYRFLMEDSIDERILALQKVKSQQIILTLEVSPEAAREMRIKEFQALLS